MLKRSISRHAPHSRPWGQMTDIVGSIFPECCLVLSPAEDAVGEISIEDITTIIPQAARAVTF